MIAPGETILKPLVSIADNSFRPEDAGNYMLSLRISGDNFSFAVLDGARNKYIMLFSYPFRAGENPDEICRRFREICLSEDRLQLKYKSVNIAFAGRIATLVPSAVFENGREASYLALVHPEQDKEIVLSGPVRMADACCVYGAEPGLVSAVKELFPGVSVQHHCMSLLEAVLQKMKNDPHKKAVLHIQPSSFDMIVTENGKLLFYNSFPYRAPEDFIYYVLFVFEQLRLNPEACDTMLLGEIVSSSSLYTILYKYVRRVSFGMRNDSYSYSYGFENLPPHFYYNLLNQNLCVS